MKRVCLYSPAAHLGGAERCLLELADGLRDSEFHPWVLLPRDNGPLAAQIRERGIHFEVLPLPERLLTMSRSDFRHSLAQGVSALPDLTVYLQKLSHLLRKKQTDLLHANGIKCHVLSALVPGAMVRLWHLHDIIKKGPTRTVLRTLRALSRIHVVANSRASLNSIFPNGRNRHVVYNGIDPSAFPRQRHNRFREYFGVNEQTKIVGILGILTRWKGQIEFLRMARKLLDLGHNVRFVIVGGEIYDTVGGQGFTQELIAEAARLGITEQVLFAGFTKNPAEALNGMDVLVHASIEPEPFGRVILEGWACQVPVVASGAGGVIEFVRHESNGLMFAPGDVDQMVHCVNRILKDDTLAQRLVTVSYRCLLQRFTQQNYEDGILDVYRGILNGGKRNPLSTVSAN